MKGLVEEELGIGDTYIKAETNTDDKPQTYYLQAIHTNMFPPKDQDKDANWQRPEDAIIQLTWTKNKSEAKRIPAKQSREMIQLIPKSKTRAFSVVKA